MKGVSKIYDAAGTVRPVVRPSSDDIKRKPNGAAKRMRRERERRQALKHAQLYLKQALVEREEVERLISTGLKIDPEGRRLDFRLKNLANREIHLLAAIERLGGVAGKVSPQIVLTSGAQHTATTDFETGATQDASNERADTAVFLLEDVGVPLPSERQKPDDLVYDLREGQATFRGQILAAYGQCAVTGCRDHEALQAAHIIPYVDARSNLTTNGICLRADIHQLFDRGLVKIDVLYRVAIAKTMQWSEYRLLQGRALLLPSDPKEWPDKRFLVLRQRLF